MDRIRRKRQFLDHLFRDELEAIQGLVSALTAEAIGSAVAAFLQGDFSEAGESDSEESHWVDYDWGWSRGSREDEPLLGVLGFDRYFFGKSGVCFPSATPECRVWARRLA